MATAETFPSFQRMIEPLLRILAQAPDGITARSAQERVADLLELSIDDRKLRVPGGTQLLYRHRTNWAHDRLKRSLLSDTPSRGVWKLTDLGVAFVQSHPCLSEQDVRALARAARAARLTRAPNAANQTEASEVPTTTH